MTPRRPQAKRAMILQAVKALNEKKFDVR